MKNTELIKELEEINKEHFSKYEIHKNKYFPKGYQALTRAIDKKFLKSKTFEANGIVSYRIKRKDLIAYLKKYE